MKYSGKILYLLWILVFVSSTCIYSLKAVEINLAWDPPTDEDGTPFADLSGFRVYYGTTPQLYTTILDVGSMTNVTVSSLEENTTYFFAVTCYDNANNESQFSEELIWPYDTDNDSLPDAWEKQYFTNEAVTAISPLADPDRDGMNNEEEFIAGTDPSSADSPNILSIRLSGGKASLNARALAASGNGYWGMNRYYTIEQCGNLIQGTWTDVPGYTQILATNQEIVCMGNPLSSGYAYRTKVWLE
jgi:hypothetical protein